MILMHEGRRGPEPLREHFLRRLEEDNEYLQAVAYSMLALIDYLEAYDLMFGDSILVTKDQPAFIDRRSGRAVTVSVAGARRYALRYALLPGENPWSDHDPYVTASGMAEDVEQCAAMLRASMAFFAAHPAPPRQP